MTAVIQPPTWNSPADGVSGLAPLLDSAGIVNNVLAKLDPTNAHHDGGPVYRQADYAGAGPAEPKGAIWYDAREVRRSAPGQWRSGAGRHPAAKAAGDATAPYCLVCARVRPISIA